MKKLFTFVAVAVGLATLSPVSAYHHCEKRVSKWADCNRNNAACRRHFCNEYPGNNICKLKAYNTWDQPCHKSWSEPYHSCKKRYKHHYKHPNKSHKYHS